MELPMILSFRKNNYDTESVEDMEKLQYILDGIDVKERVKAKEKVAALFVNRNAHTD